MPYVADGIGYIDVPCGKPAANGRGVHHVASSRSKKSESPLSHCNVCTHLMVHYS
jgi:hypothetical protein